MAHIFPNPATDGQIEKVSDSENTTTVLYRYNAEQNSWESLGSLNSGGQAIYTSDVIATPEAPRPDPAGRMASYELNPNDIDFSKLTDQRIINWTLNDVIMNLVSRIEALENAL